MTAFRVKLDENLGRSHAELLKAHGYDADRVHDQGMSGASDAELWAKVTAEERFFVTLDLDFSDVRKFQPGSHPGILLIRGSTKSRSSVTSVLERVLSETPLQELAGCLAVADSTLTRVRRPKT